MSMEKSSIDRGVNTNRLLLRNVKAARAGQWSVSESPNPDKRMFTRTEHVQGKTVGLGLREVVHASKRQLRKRIDTAVFQYCTP